MAKIIIPSPFRKYSEGMREVIIESTNLGEGMQELTDRYHGLSKLLDQPALLSLFINGTMLRIPFNEWNTVSIKDDDEITLIIPIAGG